MTSSIDDDPGFFYLSEVGVRGLLNLGNMHLNHQSLMSLNYC